MPPLSTLVEESKFDGQNNLSEIEDDAKEILGVYSVRDASEYNSPRKNEIKHN